MTITETFDQGGSLSSNTMKIENPIGLDGIEFIEYASPRPAELENLFLQMGFKKVAQHKKMNVSLYRQNKINFIINQEANSFAESFKQAHGPSICATGFRVKDAKKAFEETVRRGARPVEPTHHHTFPAIYGIGDSVIYFVDRYNTKDIYEDDFDYIDTAPVEGSGLFLVDHLTNNVPVGEMQKWCDFYEKIFNFKERRYFNIRGQQTGLISKVMRSPCGKITIPINEPTDKKSQIQEYLDEYAGSGIQHLAFLTHDICKTVSSLKKNGIGFLDTPDTYYQQLHSRLPNLTEDVNQLAELKILADGDDQGYLLQIFTQNLIGPIFFEVIQRKNHDGFGEGNFQALFDAIELDQKRRGYLD